LFNGEFGRAGAFQDFVNTVAAANRRLTRPVGASTPSLVRFK
jgi:hypothetical protein